MQRLDSLDRPLWPVPSSTGRIPTASKAEESLKAGTSPTKEQMLLERFLDESAQPARAVVVLGARVELSTPSAARMLSVRDRRMLQGVNEFVGSRETTKFPIVLSDGAEATVKVARIESDGKLIGLVIELEPTQAGGETVLGVDDRPVDVKASLALSFRGRSRAAQRLRKFAENLREESTPVLVTGESGVGKLAWAKALLGNRKSVLIDATRSAVDGESVILREVATALDNQARSVIVRRVGCLSAEGMQWLTDFASSAETRGSRVIATLTTPTEGTCQPNWRPAEGFGLVMRVPPLRERADDVLDLVPHFIERRAAATRVSPSALQALMRYDWPGNARELDALVRAVLIRNSNITDIGVSDLPATYRGTNQRLRRIDQVERAAIIQALIEGEGNKSRAAELLEIGRATLYRKIAAYGLDLDPTGG